MRSQLLVNVTMMELDRLKTIQAFVDGERKATKVAERLGISTGQLRRLTARYRAKGPVGLLSGVTVHMAEKHTVENQMPYFQQFLLVGFIESGALLPSNVYFSSIGTRTPGHPVTILVRRRV